MKQLDLVIHNKTGLHARPARVFVDIAKQFKSTIRIGHGDKLVNAKSLISVLTLGVTTGQHILIDADGVDEADAIAALEAAVRSGLGEGPVDATEAHSAQNGSQPLQVQANGTQNGTPLQAQATEQQRIDATPSNVVRGIPGAPGIAHGRIHQFRRAEIVVRERAGAIAEEQARLQAALDEAHAQLIQLRERLVQQTGEGEAAIFEVHREIMADPDLLDLVNQRIAEHQGAAAAWQAVINERAATLAELRDPLLAERATDIRDVGERVLRLLVDTSSQTPELPNEPFILVASDLTPSETASLDASLVLGFCTAVGGPNAHTAILARALGLPAVVSAGPRVLDLENGTEVIIDGRAGTLIIEPDAAAIEAAKQEHQRFTAQRTAAQQSAAEPAITTDGHRVEIVANIGGVGDARRAAESGAEGVGLLRTEFLFLERSEPPSEEEQFVVYRDIVQAMEGRPIIVRTLDIGGDKPLPYLTLPPEENPFLGERGIRLCLAHPDLLREQLRAILRAASFGSLRIMFPMIADIGEIRAARTMVEQLRSELNAPPVEVGIMIEIPSAALMADILAAEVDFFSIGTNDLTQYTLAMDRTHPSLASQADGLHPAVLRLIERTVQGAHAAGKWVGVCGELGSDPQAVPILVGLGVDELSVGVPAIATVKAQIRTMSFEACQVRAAQALRCASAAEVRKENP
jgi:phosphoenolpyruvate-protein phosphotransferase